MPNIIQLIKKIAIEAVNASDPVAVSYGYVVSISPLQVKVEQKMTLSSGFLVLSETVRTKQLKAGDKLIMLRSQGGQKFIIIDRM